MDFSGLSFTREHVDAVCARHEWSLVDCELLGSGENNLVLELGTDHGVFVLKVSNNDRMDMLENEYEHLRLTDGRFGPRVIDYDGSRSVLPEKYLLEERLVGEHPSKPVDRSFIEAMAGWYRELHAITKPSETLRLSTFAADYEIYTRLAKNVAQVPSDLRERFHGLVERSLHAVERNDGIFDGLAERCLIQGDPTLSNVFLTEPIKLIDWEFSRFSAAEEDLTFFAHAYDLGEVDLATFLDAYGYPLALRPRFDAMMLLQVWGMIGWKLDRLADLAEHGARRHQKTTDPDELRAKFAPELDEVERLVSSL